MNRATPPPPPPHTHMVKKRGFLAQIPLHIWPFFGWRFHFRNLWSLKLNHDIRAFFFYSIQLAKWALWEPTKKCVFHCLVLTGGLLTSKFSRNEINDCWFLNRIFATPYGLFGLATVLWCAAAKLWFWWLDWIGEQKRFMVAKASLSLKLARLVQSTKQKLNAE